VLRRLSHVRPKLNKKLLHQKHKKVWRRKVLHHSSSNKMSEHLKSKRLTKLKSWNSRVEFHRKVKSRINMMSTIKTHSKRRNLRLRKKNLRYLLLRRSWMNKFRSTKKTLQRKPKSNRFTRRSHSRKSLNLKKLKRIRRKSKNKNKNKNKRRERRKKLVLVRSNRIRKISKRLKNCSLIVWRLKDIPSMNYKMISSNLVSRVSSSSIWKTCLKMSHFSWLSTTKEFCFSIFSSQRSQIPIPRLLGTI
jgi:hypothetical protein